MIIIEYLKFILFILFAVFPLGKFFLDYLKIRLSFWENLLLGVNIGIVIITLFVYISGTLGLGQLFYFLPVFPLILLVKKKISLDLIKDAVRIDLKLFSIIVIITLISGYFTFFSGDIIDGKLRLIGGNVHDGLWHIALVSSLKYKIPAENPIFSGTPVQNYHYLTDIFTAVSSQFTSIAVPQLYFKILGPFLIMLFSGTIFLFLKKLTGSNIFSYLGILLVVLGSNLFYLVKIFYPSAYFNPSNLWVDEFTTKMVNPQLLLSYVVILTLLHLMLIQKKKSLRFIILFSIIGSSLLGIKSYGFILFVVSVLFISLLLLIKRRFDFIGISAGLLSAGIVFYLLSNISKDTIFILAPFWFIKVMFETPDHLAYPIWELKRQTYLAHQNFLRIGQLYFEGFLLFLFINLGGRLIGFFALSGKFEGEKKEVIYLLWAIGLSGLILPMVFIQKGVAWNSIQFFYYVILAFSMLSIITIHRILRDKKRAAVIVVLIVWISLLPGVFFSISNYYPGREKSYGSADYLQAVKFLKNQENGIILMHPTYAQDSFVPALSEKKAFFADEIILSIQLVAFETRKKQTESFFNNDDSQFQKDFLKGNNIKYIFTENKGNALNMRKIYSNKEIIIYKTI